MPCYIARRRWANCCEESHSKHQLLSAVHIRLCCSGGILTCRVSAVWGFLGGRLAFEPFDPALLLPAAPEILSKAGADEGASDCSPSLQLEPWELPSTEASEEALLGLPLLPAALPLDSERLLRPLSPFCLLSHGVCLSMDANASLFMLWSRSLCKRWGKVKIPCEDVWEVVTRFRLTSTQPLGK